MSRIVRAVSAEGVSGASGIGPLPGRSGAGLYAIERASRIRRNGWSRTDRFLTAQMRNYRQFSNLYVTGWRSWNRPKTSRG